MEPKINLEYLSHTQKWQDNFAKPNALQISQHLNSGFTFSISRNEYEQMKANGRNPKDIHYYLGINKDKEFVILVIDDVSDALGNHDNVFIKKLTNSISDSFIGAPEQGGYEISFKDALTRSFRWKLLATDWINYKFDNFDGDNMFYPLIKNSFKDLITVFNRKSCDYAHHFFGLQDKRLLPPENKNIVPIIDDFSHYILDIMITNIVPKEERKDTFVDASWPWDFNITQAERLKMIESGKYSLLSLKTGDKI